MHNLLRISQLIDKFYDVVFNQNSLKAINQKDGYIFFSGTRE